MPLTPITTLLDRIRTNRAKVGIIGLGDVGLPLAVEFARKGFDVTGFDVPQLTYAGHSLESVPFERAVEGGYDCSIVATDHGVFDYAKIAELPLVVDTRNALKGILRASIFRL